MRSFRIAFALLSLLAYAGLVHAGREPLVDPAPVTIPAGLSQEQVVKDIRRALIGRGWAITTEQPGVIHSTLNLRDHVARISVSYDAQQVRLVFVDSANLDYRIKRGKPEIHGNYLGWIGFLVNDLNTNFKVSAMGG